MGEVQVDENIRSKTVLDEVFESDDSTYISITSHSGEIASILQGMCLSAPPLSYFVLLDGKWKKGDVG